MQPTLTRRAVLGGAAALAAPAFARAAAPDRWIIRGSMPLTGPFPAAGVAGLKVSQDWVEMRNASGGIAGREIHLSYEDSGYNPLTAMDHFRRAMAAPEPPHFYYGDSTGFMLLAQAALPQSPVLMGGASFANELARPAASPWQFVTGPTYDAMAEMAMRHIAAEGGARVAIVHSDSAFGRDPLARAKAAAAGLGLEVVLVEATPLQNTSPKTHAEAIARAAPDHVFIHGYIAAVWPDIVAETRALGADARFVGTFWSMDPAAARIAAARTGDALDGYAGVMPYRYAHEAADSPVYDEFAAFRRAKYGDSFAEEISAWSLHGLATLTLLEKIFADAAAAGGTGPRDLVAALERVRGWDSGGAFARPVTIRDHAIHQARICRYSAATGRFDPVGAVMEL